MNHKECDKLFKAAKALMEKSHLVKYEGGQFTVRHDNSDAFDKCVKTAFGEEHGRYIAWILFSVGLRILSKRPAFALRLSRRIPSVEITARWDATSVGTNKLVSMKAIW